jgi:hypothetical protein
MNSVDASRSHCQGTKSAAAGSDAPERQPAPQQGMSIQEARQVRWLRSRPKPLGELLDEGYLDTARLEWTAEWAFNPQLKAAAQVLLGSLAREVHTDAPPRRTPSPARKTPISIDIRLEEARATMWPFGALRGQAMGPLVATRQLALKDLAYAVESAFDDRVRRAAIALLLERLDQELEEVPPPAGPLNVVAVGRSYAERRQLLLTYVEGLILGAGFALALSFVVWHLSRQASSPRSGTSLAQILDSPAAVPTLLAIAALLGAILLLGLGLPNYMLNKLDRQIEAYRRGEEGEERVVEKARRALDGAWTLFRNAKLPGRRKGDLDIVLVGTPGVWVLEVKALKGIFRNAGEAWYYRAKGSWKRMSKNPGRQARRGAIALAEFLRADGIKTYVSAAVAWGEPASRVTVEDPVVPVWPLERLEDELGNLWNGRRLLAEEQERIIAKLTRLCQAEARRRP